MPAKKTTRRRTPAPKVTPTSRKGISTDEGGNKWGLTYAAIAGEFGCHAGTINKYCASKGAPKRTKIGWELRALQKFIIDTGQPNYRLLSGMAAALGGESGEDGALADTDENAKKKLTYRARIERARAIKLETEVASLKGELYHFSILEQFLDVVIPTAVADIRRQLENVLPALHEGLTNMEIRKQYRDHIDKVFKRLQDRAAEFKLKLEENKMHDRNKKAIAKSK